MIKLLKASASGHIAMKICQQFEEGKENKKEKQMNYAKEEAKSKYNFDLEAE
jgi:hypothetical protein